MSEARIETNAPETFVGARSGSITRDFFEGAVMDFFPEYFDGTMREHYLLLFGSAGAIAMLIGGFSAWLGARWGARRAARRAIEEASLHGASARMEARLELLVESIDLIALEVERIAEAQRFAARLLAERPAAAPAPVRREPGVITPH